MGGGRRDNGEEKQKERQIDTTQKQLTVFLLRSRTGGSNKQKQTKKWLKKFFKKSLK